MPSIYIKKESYDKIIQLGHDVTMFVNAAVVDKLEKIKEEKGNE